MIKVFIQVEAGSRNMKLYDETTLEYKGNRRAALPYPYAYGFVLGTKASDGDNIDCYVITSSDLNSGTIVECEPVGLLQQEEDGEMDDKVLATLPGQDGELDEELLKVFKAFIYGVFSQDPETNVRVGDILPRKAALDYIQRSGMEEQL